MEYMPSTKNLKGTVMSRLAFTRRRSVLLHEDIDVVTGRPPQRSGGSVVRVESTAWRGTASAKQHLATNAEGTTESRKPPRVLVLARFRAWVVLDDTALSPECAWQPLRQRTLLCAVGQPEPSRALREHQQQEHRSRDACGKTRSPLTSPRSFAVPRYRPRRQRESLTVRSSRTEMRLGLNAAHLELQLPPPDLLVVIISLLSCRLV